MPNDTNPGNGGSQTRQTAMQNATGALMAKVIRRLRRKEARIRREEQLTGVPYRFSYCLRETAHFTGLSVPQLRRLCRTRKIVANRTTGSWMIQREQFMKLLPPGCGVTCP